MCTADRRRRTARRVFRKTVFKTVVNGKATMIVSLVKNAVILYVQNIMPIRTGCQKVIQNQTCRFRKNVFCRMHYVRMVWKNSYSANAITTEKIKNFFTKKRIFGEFERTKNIAYFQNIILRFFTETFAVPRTVFRSHLDGPFLAPSFNAAYGYRNPAILYADLCERSRSDRFQNVCRSRWGWFNRKYRYSSNMCAYCRIYYIIQNPCCKTLSIRRLNVQTE